MSYKVKSHHHTGKYWRERELQTLRTKYKGKLPPYSKIVAEGVRIMEEQPQRTHQRGRIVYYKGNLAVVDKTTQKGVWIKKFGKQGLEGRVSKPVFIEEKQAEKELSSAQPKMPFYFAPIVIYK